MLAVTLGACARATAGGHPEAGPAHGRELRGTVTDDVGMPLEGAELFVGRSVPLVRTGAAGTFVVHTSQQGLLVLGARQLAYRPAMDVVRVSAGGGPTELAFVLAPVEFKGDSAQWVRASGATLGTEVAAMQARFSSGAGSVFTWREIEARQVQFLSQLLEGGVPGLSVRRSRTGVGRVTNTRMASPCQPLVVVDGVAWRNGGNLDDLPPQIVQTIEVYRGGSTAPMKLGFDTACGAIVITTRTGR
ncbi:MAG: Plug domain-containing protein [Gemmatimonadaceae bacterium]|nr:Plug domain-containing protein [Gemmatimonadaceae bacterium]